MNITKLQSLIKQFGNKTILVIGDIMLDQYLYGVVSRISPEVPVPILKKTHEKFVLGGASNVANNLSMLGAKVFLCGVTGNDRNREVILKLLKECNIDASLVLIEKTRATTVKQRLVSGNSHQLLRLDIEDVYNLEREYEKKVISIIQKKIEDIDGVIFSDYAKGFFSAGLTKSLIKIIKKYKKKIFAGIKPENKDFFKGVDLVKPNLKEAIEMTKVKDLYKAGEKLVKFYKSDIVITKGDQGLTVFEKNGGVCDIPTKKIKIIDITGAGDTALATLSLGLLCGLNLSEAGDLANRAAGVVVQKPGTATLTYEELASLLEHTKNIEETAIVPKIWGYEKWLENNQKYCCKLLSLNKGYQCSLHYHREKDEMFFLTQGHVRLEADGKVIHMRAGDFTRIKPGTKHRFRGIEDSIIIEVSTHHEEADSYRIEESRKVDE